MRASSRTTATFDGAPDALLRREAALGRQQVAAVVCVDRFMAAPDAAVQLAALKEISSSYQRDKFVQSGGWAIMRTGSSEDGASAEPWSSRDQREPAELCTQELVELEVPDGGEAELIDDEATVAQ